MLFRYSCETHTRKHGPSGYINYKTFKKWLRDEFSFRCVYCLERERWYPNGHHSFGVDHVKPKTDFRDLECEYGNLLYACNRCNSAKGVHLLGDPTEKGLGHHLQVDEHGEIESKTVLGALMITVLVLDSPQLVDTRRNYLAIAQLRETHPEDKDVKELYFNAFGYPLDIPNLNTAALRKRSTQKDACASCFFCTVSPSDVYI